MRGGTLPYSTSPVWTLRDHPAHARNTVPRDMHGRRDWDHFACGEHATADTPSSSGSPRTHVGKTTASRASVPRQVRRDHPAHAGNTRRHQHQISRRRVRSLPAHAGTYTHVICFNSSPFGDSPPHMRGTLVSISSLLKPLGVTSRTCAGHTPTILTNVTYDYSRTCVGNTWISSQTPA